MSLTLIPILAVLLIPLALWRLGNRSRARGKGNASPSSPTPQSLGGTEADAAAVPPRSPLSVSANDTPRQKSATRPEGCCGQHETCERESLLAAVSRQIEYYDDEELDTYRGRQPDSYLPAEEEAFREVLYTMRDDDVPGWLRSLQLRGIALPTSLKDEALLIVAELRQKPATR